jgi:hypothetical protein
MQFWPDRVKPVEQADYIEFVAMERGSQFLSERELRR